MFYLELKSLASHSYEERRVPCTERDKTNNDKKTKKPKTKKNGRQQANNIIWIHGAVDTAFLRSFFSTWLVLVALVLHLWLRKAKYARM